MYTGKLLSVNVDAKTKKGVSAGILTGVQYFAPCNLSGFNVCPFAGQCKNVCLYSAGRGAFSNVQRARLNRTLLFFQERGLYWQTLCHEIEALTRKAQRAGLTPAVRLNGTSDLPWHRMPVKVNGQRFNNIMGVFPAIQFYDYSKAPLQRFQELPGNYHLTKSYDETLTPADVARFLERGFNVAAVFKAKALPETWQGFKVINGDKTDARFLDPWGCIVGLTAKGKAKKENAQGFIIEL